MITQFYSDPRVVNRLCAGPWGPHIDAFAGMLFEQGYSCPVARQKIHIAAELCRWLADRNLALSSLDANTLLTFAHDRGLQHVVPMAALRQFFQFLQRIGLIAIAPAPVNEHPSHRIEREFTQYLAQERGLQQASIVRCLREVRIFLRDCYGNGPVRLKRLRPQVVTEFMLRRITVASPGRAQKDRRRAARILSLSTAARENP